MALRARLVLRLILGVSVIAAGHALAADQPIAVKRLVLRVSGSGAESLVLISKDANVLFPTIGGPDDPVAGGAALELLPPSGANVTLAMPAGSGAPGWTAVDAAVDRDRFQDDAAPDAFSTIHAAVLKQGRLLRIVGRDSGVPLAAPLGRLALRFTTGSLRSCAVLDAASIVADGGGRFVARNAAAPAVADCSNQSLGVPFCGDGAVNAGEQCDGGDDDACPGGCRPDCTCPAPSCGDGVVNQPSEECDAPGGTPSCDQAFYGCTADCSCCALYGGCGFPQSKPCCHAGAQCMLVAPATYQCVDTLCPWVACPPELACGPDGICCEGTPGDACHLGGGSVPQCCPGLSCVEVSPGDERCCVAAGNACTGPADCCSGSCNGSGSCDP